MICLGIHSNVMLCFMVQELQDPPLCGSTKICTMNDKLPLFSINLFFFFSDLNMVTKYIEQDEVKVKELTLTLHKLRTRNSTQHQFQ